MKGISGTTEETCLAISALAISHRTACEGGFAWLTRKDLHETLQPSPIGLYFAALWYDERMYPLVCYLEALRRFLD
jgi:squalene-hopene/tetraprenyl-beta-curcumene cyclase